jgi:DNA-binding transcriptional ArsR family regulator
MIEALISSKTRVKLLLKFFLNSQTTAYLRGLEAEFGESSNAIRVELNNLERAGMLRAKQVGNKKLFRANTEHPLFREINNIVLKHLGLDQVVEQVAQRLGDLDKAYLTGDFARGADGPIIDLILLGTVDRVYLQHLVERAEALVRRKIRYIVCNAEEFENEIQGALNGEPLLLWEREKS